MIEKVNFEQLAMLAVAQQDHQQMRPVIEKELLHYDILFGLDQAGLLNRLTFQGGTSLRLCYGAQRLSEDLDFAGGRDFSRDQLQGIEGCLKDYIGHRYGLEVTVDERTSSRGREVPTMRPSVSTWQLSIVTQPAKKDVPKQRIKVQVASVDAYSRIPKTIQSNYDFLPDGYADMLIMVETLDELMADKLVSLINTDGHIRYRDIWDLRWIKQKNVEPNLDWVQQKVKDYQIIDFSKKLTAFRHQLVAVIHGADFYREMTRFLPQDVLVRTLDKPQFLDYLTDEVDALLGSLTSLQ